MTANPAAAEIFHTLHQGPDVLVLANIWDAGSARMIEQLGGTAVATSSAALAWTHGYPDGDTLPVAALLASVAAIARVVTVPISVDIEGGYSDDPVEVGALISRLIDAGAIGINIEDGSGSPALLAAKIAAARAAADAAGVKLFINARTDIYLRQLVPANATCGEALSRGATYKAAGADGLFIPGAPIEDIGKIIGICDMPVNVMARPNIPDVSVLRGLGVRRLSAGSAIAQSMWQTVETLAVDFLRAGSSVSVTKAPNYPHLNAMMKG